MAIDGRKDVDEPAVDQLEADTLTIGSFLHGFKEDALVLVRKYLTVGSLIKFLKAEVATIVTVAIGVVLLAVLQSTGWKHLGEDAWFTIWSLFVAFAAMVRDLADPDLCLFFTTTLLLLKHIITPKEAFSGFGNESIVTIAIMMVLAAGLEAVGAVQIVARFMLGKSRAVWFVQLRMFAIVASISAFMNNTPLVAVMIPVLQRFCKKNSLPPSKFMIPLSYAAILGGLCTIIGTSTNLIVKGLAEDDYPNIKIGFWDIGIVGLPMAVAGIMYLVFVSKWLLPVRTPVVEDVTDKIRSYIVRVKVGADYFGVNKSVEFCGLRGLQSLFLVDIQRASGEIVPAPAPKDIVLEGDVLSFSGQVSTVQNLLKVEGLSATGDDEAALPVKDNAASDRVIAEVVLSSSSPVLGLSVKAAQFRTKYGAAVLAVRHLASLINNPRLHNTVLQAGDSLLLETTEHFLHTYRTHPDFAVVSNTSGAATGDFAVQPLKLVSAVALFVTLIIINSADVEQFATAALVCLYGMFFAGAVTTNIFRNAIPGMILLTVAGAFGIARAMTVTGVAKQLGDDLISGFGWVGSAGPLTAIYLTTVILTALLSNGASIAIVYPIAKSIAKSTGTNPLAFFFAIMLAASSDFSTPIGYQTNLMVAGPGGYHFLDYTKVGLPLQAIVGIIAITICHFRWGAGA